MCKIKEGDRVVLRSDSNKQGIVKSLLPHPFAPSWIVRPNYLIVWNGETAPDVLTRKEIRLWKG